MGFEPTTFCFVATIKLWRNYEKGLFLRVGQDIPSKNYFYF